MYHGLSFVNHQNCEMNRTLSICKVAPTRVYCLFHTSRSCNRIPLYNSHDRRVYIPSLCVVYLQDGRVNRIPLCNSHDRHVYIPSLCLFYLQDGRVNRIPLCNSHDRRVYIPSSCVVYLQDGRVNRLFRNAHDGRVLKKQSFSKFNHWSGLSESLPVDIPV